MTDDLDPIGFVADALMARGALVERADDGTAAAIVPTAVATALGMPEVATLAAAPGPDVAFCGLGSPLLDGLIADARRGAVVTAVRWTAEPPRPTQAEALAARLVVRNGVADPVGAATAAVTYVVAALAWVAEADDRYQGLITVVVEAGSGAEPDLPTQAALARVITGHDAEEVTSTAAVPGHVADLLSRRGRAHVAAAVAPIEAGVARRREREAGRQRDYFRQLVSEARRPRRAIAASAVAARVAAIEAEAAAKRRELDDRYRLRVRITPAAVAIVSARVAAVTLRVRRRKLERELQLHLPPAARQIDALPCAACAATTRAIVLCDDAMHLLCEQCAPIATGRPACAACAGRPRR